MVYQRLQGRTNRERTRSLIARAGTPSRTLPVGQRDFEQLITRFSGPRLAELGWAPRDAQAYQLRIRGSPSGTDVTTAVVYLPQELINVSPNGTHRLGPIPNRVVGEPSPSRTRMPPNLERQNNAQNAAIDRADGAQPSLSRDQQNANINRFNQSLQDSGYPGIRSEADAEAARRQRLRDGHYSIPTQRASQEQASQGLAPAPQLGRPPRPAPRAARDEQKLNDAMQRMRQRSQAVQPANSTGSPDPFRFVSTRRQRVKNVFKRSTRNKKRIPKLTKSLGQRVSSSENSAGSRAEQQIANEISELARQQANNDNNEAIDNQSGQQSTISPSDSFATAKSFRDQQQNNNNNNLLIQPMAPPPGWQNVGRQRGYFDGDDDELPDLPIGQQRSAGIDTSGSTTQTATSSTHPGTEGTNAPGTVAFSGRVVGDAQTLRDLQSFKGKPKKPGRQTTKSAPTANSLGSTIPLSSTRSTSSSAAKTDKSKAKTGSGGTRKSDPVQLVRNPFGDGEPARLPNSAEQNRIQNALAASTPSAIRELRDDNSGIFNTPTDSRATPSNPDSGDFDRLATPRTRTPSTPLDTSVFNAEPPIGWVPQGQIYPPRNDPTHILRLPPPDPNNPTPSLGLQSQPPTPTPELSSSGQRSVLNSTPQQLGGLDFNDIMASGRQSVSQSVSGLGQLQFDSSSRSLARQSNRQTDLLASSAGRDSVRQEYELTGISGSFMPRSSVRLPSGYSQQSTPRWNARNIRRARRRGWFDAQIENTRRLNLANQFDATTDRSGGSPWSPQEMGEITFFHNSPDGFIGVDLDQGTPDNAFFNAHPEVRHHNVPADSEDGRQIRNLKAMATFQLNEAASNSAFETKTERYQALREIREAYQRLINKVVKANYLDANNPRSLFQENRPQNGRGLTQEQENALQNMLANQNIPPRVSPAPSTLTGGLSTVAEQSSAQNASPGSSVLSPQMFLNSEQIRRINRSNNPTTAKYPTRGMVKARERNLGLGQPRNIGPALSDAATTGRTRPSPSDFLTGGPIDTTNIYDVDSDVTPENILSDVSATPPTPEFDPEYMMEISQIDADLRRDENTLFAMSQTREDDPIDPNKPTRAEFMQRIMLARQRRNNAVREAKKAAQRRANQQNEPTVPRRRLGSLSGPAPPQRRLGIGTLQDTIDEMKIQPRQSLFGPSGAIGSPIAEEPSPTQSQQPDFMSGNASTDESLSKIGRRNARERQQAILNMADDLPQAERERLQGIINENASTSPSIRSTDPSTSGSSAAEARLRQVQSNAANAAQERRARIAARKEEEQRLERILNEARLQRARDRALGTDLDNQLRLAGVQPERNVSALEQMVNDNRRARAAARRGVTRSNTTQDQRVQQDVDDTDQPEHPDPTFTLDPQRAALSSMRRSIGSVQESRSSASGSVRSGTGTSGRSGQPSGDEKDSILEDEPTAGGPAVDPIRQRIINQTQKLIASNQALAKAVGVSEDPMQEATDLPPLPPEDHDDDDVDVTTGQAAQTGDLAGQYHDHAVASVTFAPDGNVGSISDLVMSGVEHDLDSSQHNQSSSSSGYDPSSDPSSRGTEATLSTRSSTTDQDYPSSGFLSQASNPTLSTRNADAMSLYTDSSGLHHGSSEHGSFHSLRGQDPTMFSRVLHSDDMREFQNRNNTTGAPHGNRFRHSLDPAHLSTFTHRAKGTHDIMSDMTSKMKLSDGMDVRMLLGTMASHDSFHEDHFNPTDLYMHALDAQRRTGKPFPRDVLTPIRNNHEMYREVTSTATPHNIDLPHSALGSQATLVAAQHRENIYRLIAQAPTLFRAIASSYTHSENSSRDNLISGMQRKLERLQSRDSKAHKVEAERYQILINGLMDGSITVPQVKHFIHGEHVFSQKRNAAKKRVAGLDASTMNTPPLETIMEYQDYDRANERPTNTRSTIYDQSAEAMRGRISEKKDLDRVQERMKEKIKKIVKQRAALRRKVAAQQPDDTDDDDDDDGSRDDMKADQGDLDELARLDNLVAQMRDRYKQLLLEKGQLQFDMVDARVARNTHQSDHLDVVGIREVDRNPDLRLQRRMKLWQDVTRGTKQPKVSTGRIRNMSENEFKARLAAHSFRHKGVNDPTKVLEAVNNIMDSFDPKGRGVGIGPDVASTSLSAIKEMLSAAKIPGATKMKTRKISTADFFAKARAMIDKANNSRRLFSRKDPKEQSGEYRWHMNPHSHDHAVDQMNNLHNIIAHDGFKTEYPDRFVYVARNPEELEQLKMIAEDLYELDELSGRLRKVSKEEIKMQRPYVKLKDHVSGGAFLPSHGYSAWRKHSLRHNDGHLHKGFDFDDFHPDEKMPRKHHHEPGVMHVGAGFGDLFESAWKSTKNAFVDLGEGIAQTAENVAHGIAKEGKHFVSKTLSDVKDVGEDWEDLGHDLKRAITHPTLKNLASAGISGWQAMKGSVDSGFEVANNTVQFIKHAPGISELNLAASFVPGIGNILSTVETAVPFADAILDGDWERAGRRGLELGVSLALGGLAKHGDALDDIASGALGLADDVDDIGMQVINNSKGIMSRLGGLKDKADDLVVAGVNKGKDLLKNNAIVRGAANLGSKVKQGLKANDALLKFSDMAGNLAENVVGVNDNLSKFFRIASEVSAGITDPEQFDKYAEVLYNKYGVGGFEAFKKKLDDWTKESRKAAKNKISKAAAKAQQTAIHNARLEELRAKGIAIGGGFFGDTSGEANQQYSDRGQITAFDRARGPNAYSTMRGRTSMAEYARDQKYQARKEAQHFEVPMGPGAAKLEGLGKGYIAHHNDPVELEERAALALNDHRREHQPRELPYAGHRPMPIANIEGGSHKKYSSQIEHRHNVPGFHMQNARKIKGKRGGSLASGGSIASGGNLWNDIKGGVSHAVSGALSVVPGAVISATAPLAIPAVAAYEGIVKGKDAGTSFKKGVDFVGDAYKNEYNASKSTMDKLLNVRDYKAERKEQERREMVAKSLQQLRSQKGTKNNSLQQAMNDGNWDKAGTGGSIHTGGSLKKKPVPIYEPHRNLQSAMVNNGVRGGGLFDDLGKAIVKGAKGAAVGVTDVMMAPMVGPAGLIVGAVEAGRDIGRGKDVGKSLIAGAHDSINAVDSAYSAANKAIMGSGFMDSAKDALKDAGKAGLKAAGQSLMEDMPGPVQDAIGRLPKLPFKIDTGGSFFTDVHTRMKNTADALGAQVGGNFRDDGPPEHERDGIAPPTSTHTMNHIPGKNDDRPFRPGAVHPAGRPPKPMDNRPQKTRALNRRQVGGGLLDTVKQVGTAVGTTLTEGASIAKDSYGIARDTIKTGVELGKLGKQIYDNTVDGIDMAIDTYKSDREKIGSIQDSVNNIKQSYNAVGSGFSGGAFGDEIRPAERKQDPPNARAQPTPDGHNLHVMPNPKKQGIVMGKPQSKIEYREPPEAHIRGKVTTGAPDSRDSTQAAQMEYNRQNRLGIPRPDRIHPNKLSRRDLRNIRKTNVYNPILHPRAAPGLWDRKIYMAPNHYEREHSAGGRMIVPEMYAR